LKSLRVPPGDFLSFSGGLFLCPSKAARLYYHITSLFVKGKLTNNQ
jgi:hypothetical protein